MKKDYYLLIIILLLIYFAYKVDRIEIAYYNQLSEDKTSLLYDEDKEEAINYRALFIETALLEEGYREGENNYTKYGAWYGLPNAEWCAIFVSWVADQAGIKEQIIPRFASVSSGLQEFIELDAYQAKDNYIPEAGDIIFFLNNLSHTGIVLEVKGDRVYTIEGNSLDMVAKRNYLLSDKSITGYGRVKYNQN